MLFSSDGVTMTIVMVIAMDSEMDIGPVIAIGADGSDGVRSGPASRVEADILSGTIRVQSNR
jgi:hypothetical protein